MRVVFLLLFALLLSAQTTLQDLKNKPEGHVRNFYIWQYMNGDINSNEADTAYSLMYKFNNKIYSRYIKKTTNNKALTKYKCGRLNSKNLLLENNATCVNKSLTLVRALGLDNDERVHLSKVLDKEYKQKSELISLMNEKDFIPALLKSGSKNYLKLFSAIGYKKRPTYFNISLTSDEINTLAKDKRFNSAIKNIVTDKRMLKMQKSLLGLKQPELTDMSYFFLALNSLKFKATSKAMMYLELSEKKAYYKIHKDKAVFWMYQVSKDEKYLKQLSQSWDINMYALYAKEKLHVEVTNYFSTLSLLNKHSNLDITDPYVWENLLDEIKACDTNELKVLLEKYNSKDDEVVNAFIYSKYTKYKEQNYIMPYKSATNDMTNEDKAILYALARQESHFIPSALSRSYALGVMQMMPFLVKALAKQKKETVSLTEMFDPYKNITYSKKHLKWLQGRVYHPLFIAYAYNGGIGFTKRHLLGGTFEKGSYEPFLSMELMANTESREYGKKVLANYVIYKKILGEEVKIVELFDNLTVPSKTDRFRTKLVRN